MKFKRMVKSIAVIMFTAVLMLDSVSANASGLKLNIGNESEEVGSLGDLEKEVESIGGGSGDVASPMKDESPTHAYRPKETILKAATCTSAGKKQVSCANPGCTIHASRVETIPALGHNLVYVYTAPTTSSTGWEGHKCSRCSYRNGTTLPRLESKDEPTKPPTPDPGTGGGGNQGGGGNGGGNQGGGNNGGNSGSGGSGSGGNGNGNNTSTETATQTKTNNKKADKKEATNVVTTKTGDPVNAFSGAHEIDFVVLSLSGGSSPSVTLSYKSNKNIDGVFGKGYSWNYESYIEEKDGCVLLYHDPTEYVEYKRNGSNDYFSTDAKGSTLDKLYKNKDNTYTLDSHEKKYDYNTSGKLVRVTQKTGETVSIEYKDKEITLKDDVSGKEISLTFNDKNQVSSVSNRASAEAKFEYNEQGMLVKYTGVDGFVTKYTYDDKGQVLTGTDSDGNIFFTDIYNEDGKIVEQKDALGKSSFFTYSESGENRITVFKDREGNEKTHTFDKDGRLLELKDEEGNVTKSEFDENGNLIKSTDALSNVTLMSYDEKDNLIKETDPLGNETYYEYDQNNNVTKVTFPDKTTNSFTYDKNNRVVESVDSRGLITKNKYDKTGLLLKTRTGDRSTSFTYEAGLVKTITDSYGNISTLNYDENGHLSETIDSEGAVTKVEASAYGTVYKTTDPLGNVRTSTNSCVDKPLTVIDEEGNVSICEYDERQLLIASIDNSGNKTEYFYDNEERLVKIVLPDGSFTENEYDKTGKLVSSTDAEGNKTSFVYNAVGNLLKEIDVYGNETTYTYNANGQVLSKTDSKGNTISFSYDSMGRKVSETNALGGVTKYSYSEAGDLISVEDALGNVTSYTYDSYGQKTSATDSNGNVTKYEYDLNGNLIETTNALGETTAFKYDSLNRLIATYVGGRADLVVTETGEEDFTSEPDEEITSDSLVTKEIVHVHKGTDKTLSANGCYKESYSSYEQVGTKSEWDGWSYYPCWNNDGGPNCQQCGQPISAGGRHKKYEDVPKYGYRTRYTCNHSNEVTGNVEITISDKELIAEVRYSDGEEYPVNAFSWKLGEKEVDSDSSCEITAPGTYELTVNVNDKYSGVAQVVSTSFDVSEELFTELTKEENEEETGHSFRAETVYDLTKAHTSTFEYDLNGRVVAETDPNGNATRKVYDKRGNVSKVIDALGYETSYVYDKNGNLVSSTNAKGQTISYEVNARNQVTKVTDSLNLSSTLIYDKNGRLKTSTNPLGGVSENIFDKKGNVLKLVGPNGGETSFTYDSNSNLISKSTVNGKSVSYTYNASNLVESMTNARGQGFSYEYDLLGRIVKANTPEGEVNYTYDSNGNVITVSDQNGTISRTYDSLNRVSSITDTFGNVVSYVYDSYGNLEKLIYPDQTAVNYTFDSVGSIKTVTDWEGRVTSYSYDSLNREIECINANGTKTQKSYDEVGNVIRIAEYKGDSLTAETIYEYDQINRLTKETETVKGRAYEYSYDDLSRVLSRITINTSNGKVINEENFNYDPAGNILTSTSKEAKKALSYIAEDNRLDMADGVKFTFDNDGNLVSGKLFDKDVTLTYDSKNRLTGFNDDYYVYDAEDYRTKSVEHITVRKIVSGGIFTSEDGGEVKALDTPSLSDDALEVSGNDVFFEKKENTETDDLSGPELFEDELTIGLEESSSDASYGEKPSDMSDVELVGTGEEESEDSEDEENNEVIVGEENENSSETEGEIEEDTAEFKEPTESEAATEDVSENEKDSEETISFNLEDELAFKRGGKIENGELVGDIEFEEAGALGLIDLFDKYTTFTITTEYCYDRVNKNLLISDSSAGKYSKYVYGNGLIASYETEDTKYKAMSGQGVVASLKGKSTEYRTYLYDIRGSVVKATNESGKVVAEYSYSTYGTRETVSGDQYSPLGYCARDGVLANLNGLIYMRARYYSPELMRFINQDIIIGDISNSNSLNRYAYVQGNPATLIDPFGLDPKRISNAVDGTYNVAKGGAMMFFGGEAMKLGGIIIAAGGPIGWVVGGCLVGVGAVSFVCGYFDVYEGGQQIANAVLDTDYQTTHLIKDTFFDGDRAAYESVEFMMPTLGCGLGQIGTAYVEATKGPTTSIREAASYDNSPAANESGVSGGPYSYLEDGPNVGPGKDFTAAQKQAIIAENMKKNGGNVKSDVLNDYYDNLVKPEKSTKGVTPAPNEYQIDHIMPKSKGGTNSFSNAQVVSRQYNREKSDR